MSNTASSGRPDLSAHTLPVHPVKATAGTDLRSHRRARAAWPARILDPSGRIVAVTVCDVSEGGMGLLGPAKQPLGVVFDVTLSVPNPQEPQRSHAVAAKVRVVFSSLVGANCRIGVQFVELPMAARITIRRYVLSNS
ncbi:MAG: PilZ protein [Rhizobacter sp.]|nr:PilZ protein [Rhizobacter sp.]